MSPSPDLPPVQRNTPALWALLTGIAALIFSLIAVGGLIGIAAIVLAVVGLTRPGRKGLAISGLVTGILSLAVAFITLLFWIGLFAGISAGRAQQAQQAHTEADLSNIKAALAVFEMDMGRYPTTIEGLDFLANNLPHDSSWKGPYLQRFPVDAWGHDYLYRCPGKDRPASYDLFSAGPDGIPNTPDDISATATAPPRFR